MYCQVHFAMLQRMTDTRTVPPLPKPRTTKGQATRARIVDAAAELVFEDGVTRTSLDDVGALARVGKSQIYHYFTDKSSLIGEVIARQTARVLDGQQPHLSQLDSWESWMAWRDQLVHEQYENHCAGGCPIGSIANELADADESTRILLVESFDQWELAFREGIVRMQTRGLINDRANAAQVASAVLATVQGGLLLCKTRKSTAPLEAALDSVIGYLHSFA
jgi:TetR/AcrR family transcriptional repressor of nem operon